ncbi:hypothetical protein D3C87_280260 [compost metagenome]
MADATNDRLTSVEEAGFGLGWDWKGEYMSKLSEDGYERFSQFSATPDTTALFAGPARFTGLSGGIGDLVPIGLTDNIQMQADAGLARLFEVGSNRSFFTRGKTQHAVSLSKFLADQSNILFALSKAAYRPLMNTDGFKAGGPESPNPDIQMNLDSETFAVPFGLLLVFKTRGGGSDGYGKALTGLYLEYCMFQNYSFAIASAQPVIAENVAIQFDRPVPVSFAS